MEGHVLISGAHGMIGSALAHHLGTLGFTVHSLARDRPQAPFNYQSKTGKVTLQPGVRLRAVINLAGPSIADGRWSKSRKRDLLDSRERLTRALSMALANAEHRPAVYLSASAVGYYGASDERSIADESTAPGSDFLAAIATSWEAATTSAVTAGIPTAALRFGVVLSTRGGVLGKMMLPFKLCLGGRLGSGTQRMSWIALPDVLGLIAALIAEPDQLAELADVSRAAGADAPLSLNLVAPEPVSNADFTRALGSALARPTPFPLPGAIISLAFGEMGRTLLLGSSAVRSTRLERLRYALKYPDIDSALQHLVRTGE